MNRRRIEKCAAGTLVVVAAWITIPAFGQAPARERQNPNAHRIQIDRGSAALWQSLRELHTRASLIMLAAHPDDEDGGVLTYETREVGADTTLMTLNRGEGGQNVMSSNFWDELGLVRTQELLASDRYYGVHQYFSRVADFGFTKTKEEALKKWGYDRVLYDCVRVVRITRPLVVTSVFAANVSDGHGQHQVSGEMAQEVYKAAADPKIFPDQIHAGLRPWAPLKMYVRLPFAPVTAQGVYDYATGHWAPARFRNYISNTWIEGRPTATIEIPVGKYNPTLGLSSNQIGRLGLNQQKSQNGGIGIPPAGPEFSGYHLYASRVPAIVNETSFFDGIDVSLPGIADYAPADQRGWIRARLVAINSLVEQATRDFSMDAPVRIAPLLAQGLEQTDSLIRDIQQKAVPEDARYNMLYELNVKRTQFNAALVQALGLRLDATVANSIKANQGVFYRGPAETFQTAIPGQNFYVRVHLADQGNDPVTIENVQLVTNPDKDWKLAAIEAPPRNLAAGDAADVAFAVKVPDDATITRPYFTRPNFEQPYYNISNPAYLNLPLMPYPLSARASFTYKGVDIVINQVVQTVHRVTGRGPVENPLIVGPAISVWVSPRAGVVPLSSRSLKITTQIHSNVKGIAQGTVALQLPSGWTSTPQQAQFTASRDGDEQNIEFTVTPNNVQQKAYRITAAAIYQGKTYSSGSISVGYPGLRPYPYYRSATYRTTGVDVHLAPDMKVGYITGTGDNVPTSLTDIGVHVTFLSPQDVTGNLSAYNAIVLGVRTYAVRPELKTYNSCLLDYVKQGGTLIVQYQTPEFDHNYGPYPYQLGGNPEKVIDETSKVVLLHPNSPALNWPNKITEHDFDGWVEERGHDFMREWDPHYTALTETHDPGQTPQRGGLLIAPYGKGFYVYAAYAFYRELPEGIPGAFRIFADLLSLSSNTALRAQMKGKTAQ
jgi:LmbE family N-acetylglucosaminyl deacetylase